MTREIAQALGKAPALTSVRIHSNRVLAYWIREGHIQVIGENPSLREITCEFSSEEQIEKAYKGLRLPERVAKLIKYEKLDLNGWLWYVKIFSALVRHILTSH